MSKNALLWKTTAIKIQKKNKAFTYGIYLCYAIKYRKKKKEVGK